MTFSQMVEFWFAAHVVEFIVSGCILGVLLVAALVSVFVVDPIKKRRRGKS